MTHLVPLAAAPTRLAAMDNGPNSIASFMLPVRLKEANHQRGQVMRGRGLVDVKLSMIIDRRRVAPSSLVTL